LVVAGASALVAPKARPPPACWRGSSSCETHAMAADASQAPGPRRGLFGSLVGT